MANAARSYGAVFDELAGEYDRHRPAYPMGRPIRSSTLACLMTARRTGRALGERDPGSPPANYSPRLSPAG